MLQNWNKPPRIIFSLKIISYYVAQDLFLDTKINLEHLF